MAKKQTRRSISVRGVTYNQLRDYCAGVDLSMSDFIEQRIADFFAANPDVVPAPRPVVVAAPAAAPRVVEVAPARKPVVAPAPVARVAPVLPPPPAPRPVPVSSSINRPVAVAARRAVSPPPPPVSSIVSAPVSVGHSGAVGRPAPTPAASVLKERLTPASPRDAKDYRAIRF